MSYDQWKCDSGYDECDPEWPCVCGDTGWMEWHDGLVIPCTECSQELELEDLDALDPSEPA